MGGRRGSRPTLSRSVGSEEGGGASQPPSPRFSFSLSLFCCSSLFAFVLSLLRCVLCFFSFFSLFLGLRFLRFLLLFFSFFSSLWFFTFFFSLYSLIFSPFLSFLLCSFSILLLISPSLVILCYSSCFSLSTWFFLLFLPFFPSHFALSLFPCLFLPLLLFSSSLPAAIPSFVLLYLLDSFSHFLSLSILLDICYFPLLLHSLF